MKKIAIRDAYGNALAKLGAQSDNIVVLEADVGGSSKSILFGKQFPDRYYNVGIAELNMTAMAAGFSFCGKVPFVNTFAAFLATRGLDAINCLICYDNLPVVLAATYCGLSDSYDGASHHSTADIAAVRALPNLTVLSPCDAVETEKLVFAAAALGKPVYLRLSRADLPVIHAESYQPEIGKGEILADGTDATIVATGMTVHQALEARKLLAEDAVSARVVNLHTIKPIDEALLVRCAKETKVIVTAEEHSIYGGLGSAVAEVLAAQHPVKMGMVGMTGYAESGSYDQLIEKYGLSAQSIADKVREIL